ncbi:eCIS core domain-containing protein [Actinophytocola sediminis]
MRKLVPGHGHRRTRTAEDTTREPAPTGVAALQRLVGNAAVSRAIQRLTNPPADTDAGSAAVTVLRSAGQPLAPPVRQEMEARLGADFATVRVHEDGAARRAAAALGARAFTSGDHVVIGEGGADRHTLAHELTHVIQQRQGPVAGADNGAGLRVSDPGDRFERAAAENARRSLAGPVADPATVHEPARQASAPTVQRALTVGQEDLTAQYQTRTARLDQQQQREFLNRMSARVFRQFYTEAAPNFSPAERAAFRTEQNRIQWQLKKIIVAPIGHQGYHPVLEREIGVHPDFGTKNHDVRVANYTDLARNLMGWVYAKENRHEEKERAREIQQDGEVEQLLNVLLRRMARRVERIEYRKTVRPGGRVDRSRMSTRQQDLMLRELRTGIAHLESQPKIRPLVGPSRYDSARAGEPVGLYAKHFAMNPKFEGTDLHSDLFERGGFLELMRHPEQFSFRDKMIGLHDLADYFGHSRHTPPTMGKHYVDDIDDEDKKSTVGFDRRGRRVTKKDRGQAGHPSTRDENSDTTKIARARERPVWAGQSYTAARMFKLARKFDATDEEVAAVAWGIFSFWRVNFDHTTEFAYHTLHEIMDIGQNFQVPYDIDNPYASLSMVDVDTITDRLRQVRDSTNGVYDDALAQVEEMSDAREEHRDRRVRQTLRDFLDTARDTVAELREMREDIADRIDDLDDWDRLRASERTSLVRFCLDDLERIRRRSVTLGRKLRRLDRKYRRETR